MAQLGDALTELRCRHFYDCSLTLVVYDQDAHRIERATAEAKKGIAARRHDTEETYNLLNAWLSVVPGNSAHNLRRLALLKRTSPIRALLP